MLGRHKPSNAQPHKASSQARHSVGSGSADARYLGNLRPDTLQDSTTAGGANKYVGNFNPHAAGGSLKGVFYRQASTTQRLMAAATVLLVFFRRFDNVRVTGPDTLRRCFRGPCTRQQGFHLVTVVIGL
jgi:hypothetical protein